MMYNVFEKKKKKNMSRTFLEQNKRLVRYKRYMPGSKYNRISSRTQNMKTIFYFSSINRIKNNQLTVCKGSTV